MQSCYLNYVNSNVNETKYASEMASDACTLYHKSSRTKRRLFFFGHFFLHSLSTMDKSISDWWCRRRYTCVRTTPTSSPSTAEMARVLCSGVCLYTIMTVPQYFFFLSLRKSEYYITCIRNICVKSIHYFSIDMFTHKEMTLIESSWVMISRFPGVKL